MNDFIAKPATPENRYQQIGKWVSVAAGNGFGTAPNQLRLGKRGLLTEVQLLYWLAS